MMGLDMEVGSSFYRSKLKSMEEQVVSDWTSLFELKLEPPLKKGSNVGPHVVMRADWCLSK